MTAILSLLASEVVSSPAWGTCRFSGAEHAPLPSRGAGGISIVIGGGGERRTLPIVARHGEIWRHRGEVADFARKLDVLRGACEAIGRDPGEIELAFVPEIIIQDDPRDAVAVHCANLAGHLEPSGGEQTLGSVWVGPPAAIAQRWQPYLDLAFRHLIADLAAPYDLATVERLPAVRAMVGA